MVTEIRVRADDVVALGAELHTLADGLGDVGYAASDDSWALGPGQSAPLLREVLTDFEHRRLVLARGLRHLGDLARHAGGAYAEVEGGLVVDDPAHWTGGGSW
jgi:hypothetical protein